jgi:hypothetical protein
VRGSGGAERSARLLLLVVFKGRTRSSRDSSYIWADAAEVPRDTIWREGGRGEDQAVMAAGPERRDISGEHSG